MIKPSTVRYTIRIIQCSGPTFWYLNEIGSEHAGCIKEKMNGQETGKMIIPQLQRFVFEGDYEILEVE